MSYWLLKTEPETWSWQQQVERGARGEPWSGVRNHQAKNNLGSMKLGELAFFYHSGSEKAIVGLVKVIREAYPDPTDPSGKFLALDVAAVAPVKRPVTLAEAIAARLLKDMVLVINTRLSVQPVTDAEWEYLCELAGVKGSGVKRRSHAAKDKK